MRIWFSIIVLFLVMGCATPCTFKETHLSERGIEFGDCFTLSGGVPNNNAFINYSRR
jgi:hypothetical protein